MSQGMDQFLATYYGTAGAAPTTETDKTAAAEQEASFALFAKVAAAEGIDLASMSDEDVMALYTKVASEDEPEKDEKKEEEKKEKEKEAAAKAELAAKTAAAAAPSATPEVEAQEKIAEADFLGRVMAHAYVQEMKKIAAAGGETPEAVAEPTEEQKIASMKDNFLANLKKGKDAAGALAGKAKEHAGAAVGKAKEHGAAAAAKIKEHAGKAVETAKKHPGATHGAAAAAAGGAGFMAGHKEKKGSALDELAAERAMAKIAEAGWDVNQGAELLSKLISFGASEENTKIAAAKGDLEGALEIRSLELLEQCGYTVNWEK